MGGLVFFTLYEQTYGSWILFSDRLMNRSAFGIEWSASQLSALGAMFILLLSPLFAWLWPRLERAGFNPGKPFKTALGILVAGLSFWILVYSLKHPQANGLVSLWWLVLAYLVLEVGELMLSPIGLSAVTQLSVPRLVGVMMGAWFLGTSYSEVLAAQLAKLSITQHSNVFELDIAAAMNGYQELFGPSTTARARPLMLRQVMGEVLADYQSMIAGLATENGSQAADSARRLANHRIPRGGLLPYVALDKVNDAGLAPRQSFNDQVEGNALKLAEAAEKGDMIKAASFVGDITTGCVGCHQVFRGQPGVSPRLMNPAAR